MRFLIACLLWSVISIAKSQTLQFGVQSGYNSTHFNIEGTSYADLRNEKLWSYGYNWGLSVALLKSKGYYKTMQYGAKIEWNRTLHSQRVRIHPTEFKLNENKYWKADYQVSFNDIALLYTYNPSHHQSLFFEIGPVFSTIHRSNNYVLENTTPYAIAIPQTQYQFISLGGLARCGLFYNINKNIAWNFAVQGGTNFTPITVNREFNRFWGGFSFTLIYKIKP